LAVSDNHYYMSIDDIARLSKQNLKSSLHVTHSLTQTGQSPYECLLNRMNVVLEAVVETNFNSSSLGRV
ncbi:hypothetical protein PFISCL1PPCAC_21273, partial [Pristionchus fissidentatus]